MRLNSLHNGLYVAARLLRAESIAVKLLPESYVQWQPADIAVGDTSQLQQFNWSQGAQAPNPIGFEQRNQALFGVQDGLSLYCKPSTNSIAAEVTINETILDALPGQFLLHERRGSSKLQLGTVWLSITLQDDSPATQQLFDPEGGTELLELVVGVCTQGMWNLYRSAMLHRDAVTALSGAAEMRHQLQLNLANPAARALLVMVEIDGFSFLRRQLGGANTDALLRRVADLFRSAVRKNDGVFRYTDAAFAVTAEIAHGTGEQVLKKLRAAWNHLTEEDPYTGLTCSTAYRVNSDENSRETNAHAFLLGTEQALAIAREQGGNRVIEADENFVLDQLTPSKVTGGVFTSDPIKDYRNNRILWQATALIATETNAADLSQAFAGLLQDMLGLETVDVLALTEGKLTSSLTEEHQTHAPEIENLLQSAIGQTAMQMHPNNQMLTLPLVSRNEVIGALLIVANESLDDSDTVFLTAIADQIAGALDRIALAAMQELLNSQEKASLRAEVQELKEHNQSTTANPVVMASKAMQDVMAYVEKIAPTDASVLIMGESGVGKEVMARAIVAASNRAHAPLITVDCSAIAHSLIDSELFGRVKGAFTGADDASSGRIAEAHGGTLFLDEIGELPMDVQAKLLRFVQEKELIAVGDTRRRHIDTRIICATNRDLLFESSQGRFRSDLYYRLQVLQVTVPPLRERQADIETLTNHFVERYSEQFNKSISGLTDAAWQKIGVYTWPGNVRELQNAIVRATLTTEQNYIDITDLQFGEELPAPDQTVFTSEQHQQSHLKPQPLKAPEHTQVAEQSSNPKDDWTTLQRLLAGQVAALVSDSRLEAPLGRWLADTVVLKSDGVARQAARLLGIPETTLRRQLNKARQNAENPFQLMSQQWLTSLPALIELLKNLMRQEDNNAEFSERCQAILLQEVANHIGADRSTGAALMGITPPTYTRWIAKFNIQPEPVVEPSKPTSFMLEQKYS